MSGIRKIVSICFTDWLSGPFRRYRVGDPELYSDINREGPLWHASLNPYLKTEADVQVKFGGFLDRKLSQISPNLTVHAELKVYDNPRYIADLSVHEVSPDNLWLYNNPDLSVTSRRAVVEVKFANYRDPNWLFENGYIESDIEKLASLPEGIARFLLLLDEGIGIDDKYIDETVRNCENRDIIILSNNSSLNLANLYVQ